MVSVFDFEESTELVSAGIPYNASVNCGSRLKAESQLRRTSTWISLFISCIAGTQVECRLIRNRTRNSWAIRQLNSSSKAGPGKLGDHKQPGSE